MRIDSQKLAQALRRLADPALDELVAHITGEGFEGEWLAASRLVGNDTVFHPEIDELFENLSQATRQHEICAYIADDLNLLYRAECAGVSNSFLERLAALYAEGRCGGNLVD